LPIKLAIGSRTPFKCSVITRLVLVIHLQKHRRGQKVRFTPNTRVFT